MYTVSLNRIDLPVVFVVLTLTAICCGSGENRAEVKGTPSSKVASEPLRPPAPDEIVPLFDPIPAPLPEDRSIPEDPVAFRREVQAKLAEGGDDEVLSMIDVLLILDPNDHEMREARARILLKQGLPEDAAVDLGLCCKGGRASCCP